MAVLAVPPKFGAVVSILIRTLCEVLLPATSVAVTETLYTPSGNVWGAESAETWNDATAVALKPEAVGDDTAAAICCKLAP